MGEDSLLETGAKLVGGMAGAQVGSSLAREVVRETLGEDELLDLGAGIAGAILGAGVAASLIGGLFGDD